MSFEQLTLSLICFTAQFIQLKTSFHIHLLQMTTYGFSKLKRHCYNQQLTPYKVFVTLEAAVDKLHCCCSSSLQTNGEISCWKAVTGKLLF